MDQPLQLATVAPNPSTVVARISSAPHASTPSEDLAPTPSVALDLNPSAAVAPTPSSDVAPSTPFAAVASTPSAAVAPSALASFGQHQHLRGARHEMFDSISTISDTLEDSSV